MSLSPESVLPPNFTYVGDSFYIVRTQAGFRQALRHWDNEKPGLPIEGFPKSYPSLVSFSNGYRGYLFVEVNCVHLKTLRVALDKNP
jgi:hypothetical protein